MQTPSKEGHKLPMLTPKNPDGSQRVIKQIMVIDPNKLRVAGLDLKMAEALKKAKGKMSSSSSSKDTKLAIAKSIVSKKIRQAQLSKESNKQTQNVTSQQLSNSITIQDAIRNLSFTNPTTPKPQIKVANLKTLMPPPPVPVSSLPQTVLLSILNSNKSDVVNTSHDSNTPEPIPKASTKKLSAQQKRTPPPKNIESKVISSGIKFEMKKPKVVEAVAPKIIEIKVISPTKEAYSESSSHKLRPKVLESKVLSPEEKIDLSTLRVKAAPIVHSLEPSSSSPVLNNTAATKCCVKEISPIEVVPSKPVVESAVDFINNLSFMFDGTTEGDSVLKNACGEDATSFLMSVFKQLPPKVPNTPIGSSRLAGTPEQATSSNPIPLKTPEAVASYDAVPAQATSEKPSSLQKPKERTVAIKSPAKVSDPPKEQPLKIVGNVKRKQSSTGTSGAPKADCSVDMDNSPVTRNSETVAESKKSPVKDDPTILHLKDSSPSLPYETKQISSTEKPRAEETPSPTSSAASARRKARKSVPVLIAKRNQNRKTPVLQEKQPEQVEEPSPTEDKSSKKLEELTKLPSEPPPQQDESPLENVTEGEPLISASTPKPSIRRRSTKTLPIVIAKLKPEMQRKPPEKDSHPKLSKKVDEDTNEVDSDSKSVTKEVIQKPLLSAYSRESQNEVTVAEPVIVKEPFSESERQLQAKEVLIPKTSKPSPEPDKLAEDLVIKSRKISERSKTAESETKLENANKSKDASATRQKDHEPAEEEAVVMNEMASRSRKSSEASIALKSVDSSPTTRKDRAIVQPAKVAAAVEREEVPNLSTETSVQTKGESAIDSINLHIQKPTQTQDKKEENAALFESITDTSQGSKTIDSSSESQGSTAELPKQDLGSSAADATLEKSDVTALRSTKDKVSHAFCSTEDLPASVDPNESLAVEVAETSTRSRNSPERPRTAKAAASLKNERNSSHTSHTRVESASTERDQARQSSEKEEQIKATAKTRRSTTAKTSTKPDLDIEPLETISKGESGNLAEIEPPSDTFSPSITKGEGQRPATKKSAKSSELADAPVEANDGGNEVTKTPASTRKSRSRSKSTAGLSSEKTTKIINIVTEVFLKESASTTESNENSVQAQPPVRPRSQRSTRAKGSNTLSDDKNPEKAIKVDSLKGKADPVLTTSKTRRRTRAEPSEELPTASEPLRNPNNTSSPAVPDVAAAESKSNELPKGKTSRTRTAISATKEVPQTLIDNSKSKKAAPRTISQLTESLQTDSVTSSTRGMRKSKVPKGSPTFENENPLPTDDSSFNSFDGCDPDVRALLDIVTAPDDSSKQDARELLSTVGGLRKTKNKAEDNQLTEKTEDKSFFGFNEQEIEEGQQSTSLRLSQSAEVVPMQSPPQSGAKKKPSPTPKVKKQNPETNWKKNSSSSLKNWLTTSDKSTEQGDGKVQQEINSSIPLKKRRARDQDLDNVKDLAQGDTSANEASREVESTQPLTPESDDSKRSAKRRQGKRKSLPGKKDECDAEDQIDELETPVKTNRRTKRKRSSEDEDTPKTEPAAKKSHLLPKAGQIAFERRKLGRPSKQESPRVAPITPRERKYKNDTEFNPRLLLITQKEEIKNDEPLIDPDMQTAPASKEDLQCALCMGYAPKKKWFLHISNHYGIGWVVGDPPPLNIKSRPSVLNYMVEFFKNSRVKGLNCRICKRQRRSALGLLTHLEQCCLTEDELKGSRVLCEHCHHEYSKSSIPVHLRTCPELLKKTKAAARAEPKVVNKVGGEDDVLSNTGRLKRKSVIKAESKLKNLDDSEFIPDEVIKHIPPPRLDLYPSTWRLEIESFGKAFCVQKKCPFTASTVDELVQHSQMDVCQFMQKVGYKCMKCKFHSVDIVPVRLHVVEKHSPEPARDFECSGDEAEFGSESSSDSISSGVDENDEDGSTVEGEEQKRKRKKRTKKMRVRIKTHQSQKDFKKLLPDREFDIAPKVKRWYEKFINENYSTEALFEFATPSVDCQTDNEGYESYLPKSPISMKFVLRGFKGFVKEYGKTEIAPENWQTLERLKGTGLENEHAAYLGGPVKSFAWAPLEPHLASQTQYLAVATRKEIDKFSKFKQPRQSRVLVNILKYGLHDASVISGEIHFAFPIDAGPVHCVEFLPSGGYAPNLNRLGLLAVATVASEIKIYSLPLEVENRECDIFPIIRLEPSIELCLEMGDSPSKYPEHYQSQCMSVAWSQTAGHNYVIGGYLNGFVAIWDIAEEDDNLNRFLVNGLRKFVPVTYFWTMDNRIKHVVPHYDMNGLRWLGICNQNRKIFLYDLRELTNPILFYAETTKNICNSLDWPIVWENPSCGHGDAMPSHGKCINTMSPMSLVFVNRRFDKFCCGVNDISYNPWRNLYAGGGDNGDIHVTPLREAILDVGLRMKIDEKAMSSLDIVSLDGSAVNKNLSDGVGLLEPDYKQKYGLVFGAIQRIVGSKHSELYADIRIPPLNMARLMRINQLAFNPNRSADCLLAVGYENGFVRVIQSDWHKTP